jgi:predicted nucleic acid-binding protein
MATTAADPIFVDTNVLVYANVKEAPLHALALSALGELERLGVEAGEKITITRSGKAVAEVSPVSATAAAPRPYGLCAGQFTVPACS